MAEIPKTTSDIRLDNWITVQQGLTAGSTYGDTAPSDDLGGPGPYLVFERGIWKYPDQATGGRFAFSNITRPLQIVAIAADFGGSVSWSVTVAGSDGTAGGPDNTSNTPYDSTDAALYREGSIPVLSGTGQYIAASLGNSVNAETAILHPGMRMFVTSGAVVGRGVLRVTFQPLWDSKG